MTVPQIFKLFLSAARSEGGEDEVEFSDDALEVELTPTDFGAALKQLGGRLFNVPDSEMAALIEDFDEDKNGTIEVGELEHFLARVRTTKGRSNAVDHGHHLVWAEKSGAKAAADALRAFVDNGGDLSQVLAPGDPPRAPRELWEAWKARKAPELRALGLGDAAALVAAAGHDGAVDLHELRAFLRFWRRHARDAAAADAGRYATRSDGAFRVNGTAFADCRGADVDVKNDHGHTAEMMALQGDEIQNGPDHPTRWAGIEPNDPAKVAHYEALWELMPQFIADFLGIWKRDDCMRCARLIADARRARYRYQMILLFELCSRGRATPPLWRTIARLFPPAAYSSRAPDWDRRRARTLARARLPKAVFRLILEFSVPRDPTYSAAYAPREATWSDPTQGSF